MELQRLYSLTRQALDDYNMINPGDKIAVGISGGKDSLTLLYALAGLRKFYPANYDLVAITVDLGLKGLNTEEIQVLCHELNVEYHIVETQISKIVFDERHEKNPCSLCSKLRKGALNDSALKLNCNKVAYAHHKDDVIETLLMSLMYEGRINTFEPVTHLDNTGIKVIRPLVYVNEADIIGFKNKYALPLSNKICPNDGNSKREYIKNIISDLNRENHGVKNRMFTAIKNSNLNGWTR